MGFIATKRTPAFLRVVLVCLVLFFVFEPVGLAFALGPTTANTPNQTTTTQTTPSPKGTNGTDGKNAKPDPSGMSWIDQWTYGTSVSIGGFIAGLGGNIFNGSMYYLVLKFGCWMVQDGGSQCLNGKSAIIGAGSIGGVVDALWKVVRDLFNIAFIFALVYIGIRTILDADDSTAQRTIGYLIAAALLINFSLYITKAVLDVADYTAVAVYSVATSNMSGTFGYTAANVDGSKTTGTYSATANTNGQTSPEMAGIADAYMNAMRISSWFSGSPVTNTFQVILFSFVVLIFAIILGLTLAYGGILLIARFITLIILMILSPAMFLGWILPSLKKHSDDWWRRFIQSAFFAPAYIFMLYIGLYALIQMQKVFGAATSTNGYAAAFQGSWKPDSMTIFIYFAVGIGFLIAATKVGESMTKASSTIAFSAAGAVKKRTLGAVNGAVDYGRGYVASSAAGSLASWYGKRMDAADDASNKPRSRTRMAYRNYVKSIEENKFGGSSSYASRGKERKEEAKRHARAHKVVDIKQQLASTDPAERQKALAGASNAQLLEIAKTKAGRELLMKDGNAGNLKASQMKAIRDSDDINDTDTAAIAGAYQTQTSAKILTGKGIGKASTDELNAVGYDTLSADENVIQLTNDKIDKLDIIDAYKDNLKKRRGDVLTAIIQDGRTVGTTDAAKLASQDAGKIADLPDDVFDLGKSGLTNAQRNNMVVFMTQLLPTTAFAKIQDKKGSNIARQIRTALEGYANPAGRPRNPGRETAIHKWLTTDHVGQNFGRT